VKLSDTDLVIDIGSNDATSLRAYSGRHKKVGIDPTGLKFKKFYTDNITLIPDFFNATTFKDSFPMTKQKLLLRLPCSMI